MSDIPSKPWVDFPHIWKTEAAFWGWVRGGLRRGLWMRHPVKMNYLQQHRKRKPIGKKTTKNPRGMVYTLECEICSGDFRQNECEVDHIIPAGTLKTLDHLSTFIRRLSFVSFKDLRVLCKPCHKTVSLAERMGVTFDEAKVHKKIIEFGKLSVDKQKKLLTKQGYKDVDMTNAVKRKACFKEALQ